MGCCERPFARVSPPVWRAQGGTASAQTTLFARSPCVRLSCVPALVGVSPALLHAGVLPHCFALTLPCLPTRCGVGAKVFARVGLYLLWACLLAGGWGLVFALLPVFVWVFACLIVCACLGLWGSVVPLPLCPACLLACSRLWCGLVGVCGVLRARWAEGGQVGAGHGCPAQCSVALPPLRCAWMRKRVGVPARSGENTRTEGGRCAGWKLACSLAWCVQPTGGVKGEVGIGPCRAGLASVRAIVGLGGDWVARLTSWWWGWVGGNDFPR